MFKPTNTGSLTKPHGINVSSAVYGSTIKLVYGVAQAKPDLIWYNDWESTSQPTNSQLATVVGQGGGGKKSGKASKKGNTKYYSAAIDLLLGHAPIRGVLSIWYNNQKFSVLTRTASGTVSAGAFSFTPGGTLAGIWAVTVNESYTATFNDYGGPGEIQVQGTWDVPLWNATYAAPGRIDDGAYHERDPYTWEWDGSSAGITVPTALNGKTVTVYYGVPEIRKSDGTFYSSSLTPLELLNLEFEQVFASGAEYANHSDQQIVQEWVSGLGSVRFDLSVANAMPNMNMETIGSFAIWPNGDADVRDVVTDIVYSGPVRY